MAGGSSGLQNLAKLDVIIKRDRDYLTEIFSRRQRRFLLIWLTISTVARSLRIPLLHCPRSVSLPGSSNQRI